MGFDHVKLEKGMYRETGKSFTQVLEREDPSEQYKGTALEGLDAYEWLAFTSPAGVKTALEALARRSSNSK